MKPLRKGQAARCEPAFTLTCALCGCVCVCVIAIFVVILLNSGFQTILSTLAK